MRISDLASKVIARLVWNESGTYSIIFAFTMIPLFAAVGLAVDFGRAQLTRDELQAAVDAAVIASARKANLTETELLAYAKTYVAANSRFNIESVNFALTKTSTGVALSARMAIDTYMLPVLGYDKVDIDASSEVMVGTGDIEVALMLDVTGSMCTDGVGPCTSGAKLDGLKAAAKDLVNIVVTGDQFLRSTRVSLVPVSTRIRIAPDGDGAGLMAAMTGLPGTWSGYYRDCTSASGGGGSEGSGNWVCHAYQTSQAVDWKIMPCVVDRFYNDPSSHEATDAPPGPGFWLNAHGGDRFPLSLDSTSTPILVGTGQTPADPMDFWTYAPDGYCADVAESNVLMPLSSDKQGLLDRIDSLEAYGSTAGALGTAMAWYTISPSWSGVFSGSSAPAPYSELAPHPVTGLVKLKKAVVLMTDGVYNTYRGWKDADQQTNSDYATDVCDNMKAAGIEVYTVGFALDELTAAERIIAEATLEDCATAATYYYDADTVAELNEAFQSIGSKLSALRLTR